jgi:hypothetical protein
MLFNVRAVATIAGTVLLLSAGVCLADDAAPKPSGTVPVKKSAPAAVRVPKTTELPPSALGIDTKSRGYEPGDEKSDLNMPNQIQLGNNTLHFDADKKNPVPPVGVETNEQSVLNKAPTEPALKPSYFGLRLTSPMNLFTR